VCDAERARRSRAATFGDDSHEHSQLFPRTANQGITFAGFYLEQVGLVSTSGSACKPFYQRHHAFKIVALCNDLFVDHGLNGFFDHGLDGF